MHKFAFLFLLLGFRSLGAQPVAESNLTTRDKVEITYKAEAIVKELENLMNVISNSDLYKSEIDDLISFSYGQSNNKIFYNDKITLEDDIDPLAVDGKSSRDISVRQYLGDLNLLYTKSEAPSITFSEIKVSRVYEAEYVYVRVYFESRFTNEHKTLKTPYKPTRRVAEVRAEQLDKQWETQIASIIFYDDSEPIESADYQTEITAPTHIVSTRATDTLQINEAMIREAERQRKLQEELFEKMMVEVRRLAEKEEEQKKEASKKLIEEGDVAFAEGDYEQALRTYREAKLINPYQTMAFSKINRTQKAIDTRKQKAEQAEKYYIELVKDAEYAFKIRDFQKSILLFREAKTLRPGEDKIAARLREAEKLIIPLHTLEAKYRAGDYNGALKDYTKSIKDEPENPDLYLGRGKCYLRLDKGKQAFADFTKAIELYPDFREAYILRAGIHQAELNYPLSIADLSMALTLENRDVELYAQRSKVHQLAGNMNDAIADYTWAIGVDSLNGTLFLERGLLYRKTQKLPEAIADFSHAVKIAPELAEAWYQRGLCRIDQGDILKASSDFQQAKKQGIDPATWQTVVNLASGHYNTGKAYFNSGNYDDAITSLTNAVTIFPAYTEAWYARAESFEKKADITSANKDYTEAVVHDSTYFMAYYRKGVNLSSLGEHSAAAKELQKATQLKVDYFPAFVALGDAFRAQDQFQSALDAYKQAIKLNNDLHETHFHAGLMLAKLNRHPEAIESYGVAIRLRSTYSQAFYYRGLSYNEMKDDRRAIADFSTALKENAQYAEAYYERGKLYSKNANLTGAVADFSQAINYHTTAQYVYFLRGKTQEALKQYAKALEDYQMAENTSSGNVELYNRMGNACLYLGKWADGRAYFEKVLALEPGNAQALYGKGSTFAGENQLEPAVEWLGKAFQTGAFTAKELKTHIWLKPLKKAPGYKEIASKYLK
ncbi:MAG: tetratricopeptide repeat protein [Bacteroidia bacterium]|nr:tetratricopeptide repeat protein [Bacteroidia bacterium]